MRHTLQSAPVFNPIHLTITMESPEDVLLIWATLGVATDDVRKLIGALNKEDSRRLLRQAIDKAGQIIAAHPKHNGCALIAHAALVGA